MGFGRRIHREGAKCGKCRADDSAAENRAQEPFPLPVRCLQRTWTIGKRKPEILRYADNISRQADGDLWLFNDVVSIAFCALIDFEKAEIVSDQDVEECRWWDINDLPELLYDHNQMVSGALEYLRVRCYLKPIGKGLLPEKFTLPDLKSVYETLLRKKLDDRNFSKKMLHIGLIEKLTERKSIGPHRSPFMYRFNEETYERLTKDGSIMIIS
ncbi:MAG: hypothetical protein IJV54_14545 [Bacteroidales bacterium]|nr:hypothetical protein [Bacteroidales bacterium]